MAWTLLPASQVPKPLTGVVPDSIKPNLNATVEFTAYVAVIAGNRCKFAIALGDHAVGELLSCGGCDEGLPYRGGARK